MIMMLSLLYHYISLKLINVSFLLKLPFCGNNEVKSKHFFKKNSSFYEKWFWYCNQVGGKKNTNSVVLSEG